MERTISSLQSQIAALSAPDLSNYVTNAELTLALDPLATVAQVNTALMTHASSHAGLAIHDGSTAQTVANGATYSKILGFNVESNSYNGSVADVANDQLVLGKVGWYFMAASFSFSTDTNLVNVFMAAFLDGVEVDTVHFQRKIGTGSDVGAAAVIGLVHVTAEDQLLDVRMRHDYGSSVDVTLEYANMTAFLLPYQELIPVQLPG